MELNQYMERAFSFEENGYVEEAIQLCTKCMQAFPEYESEIAFEIAKMNYRNGKEEDALKQFYELYEITEDEEIAGLVLDAYYQTRLQEYAVRYQNNCRQLESYPYFFGTKRDGKIDSIQYYPLLSCENKLYYYDCVKNKFEIIVQPEIYLERFKDGVCLLAEMWDMKVISDIEKMTRKVNPVMDNENPFVLAYHKQTWELFLQLSDLEQLCSCGRMFFLDSPQQLETALVSGVMDLPNVLAGFNLDKWKSAIQDVDGQIKQLLEDYKKETIQYYKDNSQAVLKHIEEGRPKILFITSRYTTALQYHTRDCREAAEKLGIETRFLIEPNRFMIGQTLITTWQVLAEFKPDILFVIDYFRFNFDELENLEQPVFIGWVQDPMVHIMDVATPGKLGMRDIVLSHFFTWKNFKKVGYDEKHIINAPVPADSHVYKKYNLTAFEKETYSCDICFVCHSADADGYIKEEIARFSEEYQNPMYEVLKGYQKYAVSTGNFFGTIQECRQYIQGALWQHYLIELPEQILAMTAYRMYLDFNEILFRQALVEWLISAGYQNIKLWGNGWVSNSRYAEYAMGPAENGETLSKIYQASKIVVGNNFHATGAARAWESMLSGAFYMSNYVSPENDAVDIRKIMTLDEEIIMFRGREDFLAKVEYYLTHDKERLKMAKIGHKAALERMTYDIMMKRVLTELPEKLKLLEQQEKAGSQ